MEEINAWGAYESGTTQTARRLDGGVVRQRRTATRRISAVEHTFKSRSNSITSEAQLLTVGDKAKSCHSLFFGTDDINTLKKKTDVSVGDDPEKPSDEPSFDAEKAREVKDIHDLAKSIFHVYFTNHEGGGDAEQMKRQSHMKAPGFLNKMNGTMPWLPSYLKDSAAIPAIAKTILFMEACFRGIAQVFFQNNPLSGVLILTAMFIQSSRVAVHGIIAIIIGNLSGLLMGFDKSFLSCGLFGYNSFLVGLAISTFDAAGTVHLGYNWSAAIGVIITSYFSSVLFVMLGKILSPYKTPPFTLPFNISTLVFLMAVKQITRNHVAEDPDVSVAAANLTVGAFFAGSIRGVGQVFLANNIISGVLVLVGIMVCSRISAVAAFVGSVVGAVVAALVGEDATAIENGMYGFNSSLILTAMIMFYVPSVGSVAIGIVASALTVFVQLSLEETLSIYGLPFMTLPFCLAALAFIVIQGTTSNVISVPLNSMTTPEDHLSRVRKLSAGFDLLFGALRSSSYQGNLCKSWKSLVSFDSGNTKRMNSVLQEYDEEIHGGEVGRGCLRYLKCCKQSVEESRDGPMSRMQSMQQMFRMSFALNSSVKIDDKASYYRMFNHIDTNKEHKISKSAFESFLRSVGLKDEVGLEFALDAFQLMDLDKSGDIDSDEFIAFAKISKHMPAIRDLVAKFFDFVDVNGDRAVEISELDSARDYLNLPAITEADRNSLTALCNGDEELEFDMIVNFVTIFKLKSIIKEYQEGVNLDDSIRSSIRP